MYETTKYLLPSANGPVPAPCAGCRPIPTPGEAARAAAVRAPLVSRDGWLALACAGAFVVSFWYFRRRGGGGKMNRSWFLAVLCMAFLMPSGCAWPKTETTRRDSPGVTAFDVRIKGDYNNDATYYLVEIDDCEYLIHCGASARPITHKGNCKYCLARSVR